MQTIQHLRRMHLDSLATCAVIVGEVRADDLGRETPCAGWDLRRLLSHMIGQNHGFAAAVEAATTDETAMVDLGAFADRPVGNDPSVDFQDSATRLTAAFAAADGSCRVVLPELSPQVRFRLADVIGFQLVDSMVHGWDIAASLGRAVRYADDLVAECLAQAERIPDGANREAPHAPFAHALDVDARDVDVLDVEGVGAWERTLLLLGRDPAWTGANLLG